MPIEERLTALEQGLASAQLTFVEQIAENSRQMAMLNRVISDQMLNLRDVNHNMTILVGVVGEQGRDIKAIREDVSALKGDMQAVKDRIEHFDVQFASIQQQLAAIVALLSGNQPTPPQQ